MKNKIPETILISISVIVLICVVLFEHFSSPKFNEGIVNHKPPETVLSAIYEEGKIDLNNADADELSKLKNVGKVRAQIIIDYRFDNGGFVSADELLNIDGIPESVYEMNKDIITVGIYSVN